MTILENRLSSERVAQEEAGEVKDAIIYFERNAWLLKKALGANFRNQRNETLRNITRFLRRELHSNFGRCFVFNAELSEF
jgi:hypothetical protein